MALRMSDNLRKSFKNHSVYKEEKNSMDKWFSPAGDLDDNSTELSKKEEKNSMDKWFSPAGDLDNTMFLPKYNSKEEIVKYLSSVVSGKKFGFQNGMPYSSGSIIVSFRELKEMVELGDNIVKAECLDNDGNFISIEFESFGDVKNNNLGRGR